MEVCSTSCSTLAELFGTYDQFINDCKLGKLSDYSFIEPNDTDHDNDDGEQLASDQHPDHNIQAGELYRFGLQRNRVKPRALGEYRAAGGLRRTRRHPHEPLPPPACILDGHSAGPASTGLNYTFNFDRLECACPPFSISPWIPKSTVVGTDRVFEHASIPATVTKKFIGNYTASTAREQGAQTFLDLLSLDTMRTDTVVFNT